MAQPLVTADQLLEALRGFPLDGDGRFASILAGAGDRPAVELARQLVEAGGLTRYQADLLLAGRRDDLVLGHYVLVEPVGAGGMGQVFKAWHGLLNRPVALKVIRDAGPKALDRFRREIQLLARLTHPNIVTAHDAVIAGDRLLLVMEFCDGVTLGQFVREGGPLTVGTACHCAVQAAHGMQHAFESGLVHRDIKPDNLMLQGPALKVLDFGLARLHAADGADGGALTSEHTVLGTPDFIAPEQALDVRRADIRSDIYSLGATLYCLLTGQVPFPGGTVQEKLLRHQVESPLPVRQVRPDLPAAVGAVVDRMLRKEPGERYQTPAEVARALEPFARFEPPALPALPAEPEDDATPLTAVPTFHAPVPPPTGPTRTHAVRKRPRLMGAIAGMALGCGLLAVGVLYLAGVFDGRSPGDPGPGLPTGAPGPPATVFEFVRELKPHPNRINSLAFSHDSALLAVACGRLPPEVPDARGVQIWDVANGKALRLLGPQDYPGYLTVAFSPKERLLAATTGYWNWQADGFRPEVQLWDPDEGKRLATIVAHPEGVSHVTFSPDGSVLCTVGRWDDRTIRFWDVGQVLAAGKKIDDSSPAHLGQIDWAKGAKLDPGMVSAVAFAPAGNRLVACNHAGLVQLYEGDGRGQWKLQHQAACPDCPILYQVAFSPDGQRVATVGGRHTQPGDLTPQVAWWEADFLVQRRRLPNPSDVWSMTFTPDSRHVLAGDADGVVTLWDLDRELALRREKAHDGWASVALAPNRTTMATGGATDRTVKLWKFHGVK
jgi:serine/threonine-protein kinase